MAGVLENTSYASQITTMENNRQSSPSGRLGPPLRKSGPHPPTPPCALLWAFLQNRFVTWRGQGIWLLRAKLGC